MTVEFAVQNTTSGKVDEFHTQSVGEVVTQLELDRVTLVLLGELGHSPRLQRVIEDEAGARYRVVCRQVGEWEELT